MKTIETIYKENLDMLIREHGGVRQLADFLGKSYSQVSQWKNSSIDSKTGKPRSLSKHTAKFIEEKCGKPHGWMNTDNTPNDNPLKDHLDTGGYNQQNIFEGMGNTEPGPSIKGEYPLISWVQAGDWSNIMDDFNPGDAEAFYACPKRCSAQTFMLRVRGRSMEPKYQDGDLLFVDPDASYQHGSNVIVKLTDAQEATFKRLVIDGNKKWLEPLNPDWPEKAIQINGNAKIVGVVIGKWVPD